MKSVAQKLLIAPDDTVFITGGALPDEVPTTDDPARASVAVVFATDAAALDSLVPTLEYLTGARAVWVGFLKGNASDLNRDSLRERLAPAGWEAVANVSIDEAWSALRVKRV